MIKAELKGQASDKDFYFIEIDGATQTELEIILMFLRGVKKTPDKNKSQQSEKQTKPGSTQKRKTPRKCQDVADLITDIKGLTGKFSTSAESKYFIPKYDLTDLLTTVRTYSSMYKNDFFFEKFELMDMLQNIYLKYGW